ncbi:MAG: hypothetical protein R6V10_05100 [bacterium]
MKRLTATVALLVIMAVAAVSPAQKQNEEAAEPEPLTGKAEAGKNARDKAIADAREKALANYIEERVPGPIRQRHRKEVQKLIKKADKMTRSFEIVKESESKGVLTLQVRVELDREMIDKELKKYGLMPARSLPKVFLFVPCRAGDEQIKSAWQKPRGIARTLNPCEAAISERLGEYGIEVVEPGGKSPELDLDKILNPRSEEQKKEVFQELEQKLGVSAMVVGKGKLPGYEESKDTNAVLLIAVADLAKERVFWSERIESKARLSGPRDRAPALEKLCGRAGENALLKIYSAWAPTYKPGEERTIAVSLLGLSSYQDMQEFAAMLREQAPGVSEVVLSGASPGEVRYEATTTVSAETLARWLEGAKVDGGKPRILSQGEDTIRAALVR